MPGGTKHRRRDAAALAVVAHPTLKAAAVAAGIGEATLCRWLREETFIATVERYRSEVEADALASLRDGMTDAVCTLREIARDTNASDAARVSAARSLADLWLCQLDRNEVIAELEAIRSKLEW